MTKFKTKVIFLLISSFLVIRFQVFGQFKNVEIGVNGMTCSACTQSVQTSLLKLPFVDSVFMDLENSKGRITLKKDKPVDLIKISKAISKAGFNLRFLKAEYSFTNFKMNGNIVEDNGNSFYFLQGNPEHSKLSLRFIGQLYQTKKEFAKKISEFPKVNLADTLVYYVLPLSNEN